MRWEPSDPVEIAKNAIKHAKDYGNDIVILDTAGRLHIDEELMQELQDIKNEVHPNEILLVIDAMTGQDAVNVAENFNETLGIDGVILTKLDGDTRGGAALSVRAVTGKPIKFAGTGEKLDDLEVFHPDRMASRILGMGDVLTLIEKAQDEVDEKKAAEVAQKLKENSFDMEDLLEQIKQVRNMGPLGKILEMFPGMSGKVTDEAAQAGEQEIKYLEAIINSMTKAERANPRSHQSFQKAPHRGGQRHRCPKGQPGAQAVQADEGNDEDARRQGQKRQAPQKDAL